MPKVVPAGLQTLCMFVGELLCLVPFGIWSLCSRAPNGAAIADPETKMQAAKRWRRTFFVFLLPATCDAGKKVGAA